MQCNAAGQVVLKLKTPWRDGTTHLVMSPVEFMQRLAALVPRPRLHLIRFHGVLAPNAKLRAMVVPQEPVEATQAAQSAECEANCSHHRPVRLSWARLLKRVFEIDLEHCPNCAGQAKARKAGAAASSAASAAGPGAGGYAQRFAGLCAACHGANGRSDMPLTPVLAGQPSFYAITQLFLFREGRRGNEGMTAVAMTLTDDDMRGFSDYIGTLPPVPAPPSATSPDAARIDKARALAQQHKCVFCHGADFSGGQQVPRIAGQREDYLQMSLRGFRSGTRPGYTQTMSAAVSQIPLEDLDTLDYYVARFPGVVAVPAGK